MQEVQSHLTGRETAHVVDFDPLKHRVRCYAHIINICSSHIISSMTSVSEQYLSDLKVPVDTGRVFRADDDDLDDDDINANEDIDEFQLDDVYDDRDKSSLKEWFESIKRDPLRRARRIIRLLRSSDQRREGFRMFIQDGNKRNWFYEKTRGGKRSPVQVPELQLLRDVKTRWDSVYLMLHRLRLLRPVSSSQDLSDWTLIKI